MSPRAHKLFRTTLVAILVVVALSLSLRGVSYYSTPLEERFYHPDHQMFKPSGPLGHGLGIIGTLLILFGVSSYMIRKRVRRFSRVGRLKYWLEFHIFLCSLGPLLVLFHTAFKFGGLVSIAFWSMVAVVLSGVIGRFIYIQIPRSIEGRALTLKELEGMKSDIDKILRSAYELNQEDFMALVESTTPRKEGEGLVTWMLRKSLEDRRNIQRARKMLLANNMTEENVQKVVKILRQRITLENRIANLQTMHRLFRYWHVAHLPFALIMLVIVIIHVAVTLLFGYRWIF